MNLRFVESFYWVVMLKSVTRAADKMFLTQSAVSSRISALEDELGVLLLDRRDKQFRLTLAGTRFFRHAERLLELQREVKTEMGQSERLAVTVRIGAIESVLHSWLVPWLEQLRAEHPGLSLELSVDTTPTLLDQVSRGVQDLVFAALPVSGETMLTKPFPSMEMAFIGDKATHRKRQYTLDNLCDYELLTFQRGSQPHVHLVDLFNEANKSPKRIHTISSISAMAQLVQGGFGIATLPLQAVRNPLSFPNLKPLKSAVKLHPLPIHASYRVDPTSREVEMLVASAAAFVTCFK
jgi:DNA-binding transcriptional LysR family regulator